VTEPDDEIYHSHDVFISYAHVDAKKVATTDQITADTLGGWLKSLGYDVWWDRSLIAGDLWLKTLVKKATYAKRVIVLWSPQAAASDWVRTETRLGAADDKLIPLIIEKHPPSSELQQIQFVDAFSFEEQKGEILKALKLEPSGKRETAAPPAGTADISIAALPTGGGALVGRAAEKQLLADAWASTAPGAPLAQKTNIAVLHAIGGAGKTALLRDFLDGLADQGFAGAGKVYGWSAYSQGSGDNRAASADVFIAEALRFFGHDLAQHPIADAVARSPGSRARDAISSSSTGWSRSRTRRISMAGC
jgi:hypothetical protein